MSLIHFCRPFLAIFLIALVGTSASAGIFSCNLLGRKPNAHNVRTEVVERVAQIKNLPKKDRPDAYLALSRAHNDYSVKEIIYITTSVRAGVRLGLGIFLTVDIPLSLRGLSVVEQIVDEYVRAHTLGKDDIIQLAGAAPGVKGDEILTDFAQQNRETLSPADIVELAGATDGIAQDKILTGYCQGTTRRLSAANICALAGATDGGIAQDEVLKSAVSRAQDMAFSTAEVISIAQAADSGIVTDEILQEYAVKHAAELSPSDVVDLAQATDGGIAQDEILLEFARSQKHRLRVPDLRKLAKATDSDITSDDIKEFINER